MAIKKKALALLVSLVAFAWGFPTLWILYEAFFMQDHGIGFTLQNFREAFSAAPFALYFMNTLEIVLGLLAAQLIFGVVVGFIVCIRTVGQRV